MISFNLCADFSIFPDNHELGPNFSLAGFIFNQLGGMLMFVNVTGDGQGLQVPDEGIEVVLPTTVAAVDICAGAFNSEAKIIALDVDGNEVATRAVPPLNDYIDIRMTSSSGIAALRFKGGGNELIIPKICITICCC